MRRAISLFPFLVAGQLAQADPPVIEKVTISDSRINVTVTHPDTGWDHYADLWRVFLPDGTLLAERVLLHPHETEQPFTRSADISIPDGVANVTVVASCTHGEMSEPYVVTLGE